MTPTPQSGGAESGGALNRRELIQSQRESVANEVDRLVRQAHREAQEAIERARRYAGFGTWGSGTVAGFASCARHS